MQRELAINLLKTFKENNQQKYGIEALGLFGSTARDEAKPTSDVDICIKTKNAIIKIITSIKIAVFAPYKFTIKPLRAIPTA